ncbi:acyl-CoA thioesterase [Sphingobacteriales bacterium UPWRP_1]|nr:hypothetical protein B6N25_04450 [Sphingobacteriales bacterium TSM_CSS]PSJ73507.1 acyl-CoA thioesterase [Sphingobacteriales bacterium UPWRP_1]
MSNMSLPAPDKFKYAKSIEVRWRDLDALNHVNNAVYLTYMEHARSYYLQEAIRWDWTKDGIILANATIDFKVALLLTDKPLVHVRCLHLGNKSFTLQYAITTERNGLTLLAATAQTVLVMYDFVAEKTLPLTDEIRQKFAEFEGEI